jgi:Glycosyltransferases, probably involved in cell wall biogenesis
MSALPTITLVTPSFNQARYIERTIRSVIAQEYSALEWIVVDAMSTDETAEILDRYRDLPFLRVIREPDRGQTDAINKGLRQGHGEIAGWLNSDDELLPGALHAVARAFAAAPEAVAVYGAGRKVDEEGRLLKHVPSRPFDPALLRTAFYILQPAFFFRRQLVLDLGGLDEALHYAMDWELAMRLAERGPFATVNEELAALRCYAGTKTEGGGWQRFEEIARIGRRMNGAFDRNLIAWKLRRLARGSALARRCVDFILSQLYPERSVMVVGWPEDSKS